jgi:branched-subunit amino acid transport protein
MNALLIFFGMALVTFFTRYTMIALFGHGEMPPRLLRWLYYVPPAVLAALIVPAVLAPQGKLVVGLQLWAFLAAVLVAWRTRNIILTIVAGLVVFWLLKALTGI